MVHSLYWDEALQIRRSGRGVRVSDAHTFLHNLRLSLTHDRPVDGVWGFTEEVVDLTNCARVSCKSEAWLELIFGDPLPLRRGHQHGRDGGGPRGSTNSRRGCDEHISFGVKGAHC